MSDDKIDAKTISITDPKKTLSEKDQKDDSKIESARANAWARPSDKTTRDKLRENRIKAARGY